MQARLFYVWLAVVLLSLALGASDAFGGDLDPPWG
jgi:hypothetical protein